MGRQPRPFYKQRRNSMSLTDDFKNKKLIPKQAYYCRVNDEVKVLYYEPAEFEYEGWCLSDTENRYFHDDIREVIAPCDYEELKKVKEELNESGKESAGFEMDLYDANRWNKYLLDLLKECKEFLENDGYDVYSWSKFAETEDTLLTRINAALGKEE